MHTLYKIQEVLAVTKKTGVEAYRFRIGRRECILDILNRVNGLLLTKSKQAQLIKMCEHLNPLFHLFPNLIILFKIQLG